MRLVKKEVVKKVIEEIPVYTHQDLFKILQRELTQPVIDTLRASTEAEVREQQLFLDLMVSQYIAKFNSAKLLEYCKFFYFVADNAELDSADVSS